MRYNQHDILKIFVGYNTRKVKNVKKNLWL